MKTAVTSSLVGNNIRRLRVARGMFQSDLGDAIGKNARTISNWEIGARDPGSANIRKLAKIFGVAPQEIIGHSEAPTDTQYEYIIRDNAMSPEIKRGDTAVIDTIAPVSDGDYVIVSVGNDKNICRRLYRYAGMISLLASDQQVKPIQIPEEDIEIKGRVTEVRRRFP